MSDFLTAAYSETKVAVLGASGFIGRWVARMLSKHGARLCLVVRNRLTAEAIFNKYGIDGEIYELDLSSAADCVSEVLEDIRPSITFNLSGYGVDRSEQDAKASYEINSDLVGVLCQAVAGVRDTGWCGQNIVHAGSALEYGPIGGNLSEDSAPNPTTLHGESKLRGTRVLAGCRRRFGISALTARLFTVYGPGEHPGRLLPSLVSAAKTGHPLELTSGFQKRDFTYIEDVAEGLLRLGLVTGAEEDVVNLATGRLTSVRDFVHIAANSLAIPLEHLRFGAIAGRAEEMEHDPVSLDRLKGLTAWVPSLSVPQGIRKTLHFERHRS